VAAGADGALSTDAIALALTDDFIDPHREATDLIFRIGSLPDSSVHARVLGMQHHYLVAAPDYLQRCGTPGETGRSSPSQHAGLQRFKWT
jgi:DNA-binding transcriptional LysR family regulator